MKKPPEELREPITSEYILTEEERKVLALARATYGNDKQMLVAVGELCELAEVCTKYPRYDDKNKALKDLYAKAVDEVADVLVILDHVTAIFDMDNKDISKRVAGKIARLRRWLSQSSSLEQSTVDRAVDEISPCIGCNNFGDFRQLKIGGKCYVCAQNGYKNWEPKDATE